MAETVYYCWFCDAHRRLKGNADGTADCPRCRQLLPADCRLTRPLSPAASGGKAMSAVEPALRTAAAA